MRRIIYSALFTFLAVIASGASANSLHPDIQLLDDNGNVVMNSNQTVSAQSTCGNCHDTSHINDTISRVHKRGPDEVYAEIGLLYAMGETPRVPFTQSEANCLSCHLQQSENELFDVATQGWVSTDLLELGRPKAEQCGACHSTIHSDINTPFTLAEGLTIQATLPTGQIFAGQKISESGLNITGKEQLSRSFDVHAERVVECVDCHGASNNPSQVQIGNESRPTHLQFDPRRMDFAEYLKRPSHDFQDTQRECVDCHESDNTHSWLPYAEQHFSKLSCQSCHIPELFAPAAMLQDWTTPISADTPETLFRGIDGDPALASSLVTGYQPLLLPNEDGKLQPVNLMSVLHWRSGDRVLTNEEVYGITKGIAEDTTAVREALTAAGYTNLTLQLDVMTQPINHNVTEGKWISDNCRACHEQDSRLVQGMSFAASLPEDTTIVLRDEVLAKFGTVHQTADGHWQYRINDVTAQLYVMGGNTIWWVDVLGLLMVFGVIGISALHGGLRYLAWRKRDHTPHQRERVYMYTLYERLWHWLQALVILLMIATGAVIHRPDLFGVFSFPYMVQVHNVLAFILVVNAVLALFYNLSSGHIKQFLPMPADLFVKSFVQLRFYASGIFKGDAHPFEKTVDTKLNPMQKVAYFGLLNFLLPAQVITGAMMWGAQRWPNLFESLGGLLWLGPIHSLLGWAFLAFIFMHIYLTTTSGPKPLSGIQAMVEGWEDVEVSEEDNS